MGPLDRFRALMAGPEAGIPLDEAALLIAACARPGLDVAAWLARLDALAAGCRPSLEGLRRRLYVEHGFVGNSRDYYDPRNSFLDAVIARRTGIPISLAVIAIAVGRRAGVELVGIGMPGHFLVRGANDRDVFLDPFSGALVDQQGCRAIFERVCGPEAAFTDAHLAPVGPRAICARMLANLRAIYRRRGDPANLAWVLRCRLAIPGADPTERVELAAALAALGHFREAAAEIDRAASERPALAADLQARAAALRARLN